MTVSIFTPTAPPRQSTTLYGGPLKFDYLPTIDEVDDLFGRLTVALRHGRSDTVRHLQSLLSHRGYRVEGIDTGGIRLVRNH